ncbi:hypothetical protein BJ322DRAFT_1011530 [Thelephora terrestris]|uniref:Ubiquitin-like protease family profile domain-containing protein n=1 Tax=Thelephora terrestris TaxID=56493 RepID=A0A9P6H8F6_9AGAM|nr:hypothetical protein BJ322DRAFT_1011530 [Thelephora terrestris]
MDPIDLTSNSPFYPSIWIGVEKTFSDSLPPEVLDAKQITLEIPETFHTFFPLPTTRVSDFIHWNLPFQSDGINLYETTQWFSNDLPHTDPSLLLARSIPPVIILKALDAAAGQMWMDGSRSVVDPRFNNGEDRFPLWVLSLWNEARKLAECQDQWRRSVRWLDSLTHPVELVACARSIVGRLSLNAPLRSRGATSLALAGFLGAAWLSDIQIDMMIDTLRERMRIEERAEEAIIESAVFSREIWLVSKGTKEPTSKFLSRVTDQIRGTHAKALWFPIYVDNCHWIAGRVDFERRTFAFGDSMVVHRNVPPPQEALNGLGQWLEATLGWKPANEGNILERPHQTDTVSCSVCTLNTIAHNIFGDPLWEQRNAAVHRVSWLLEFEKYERLDVPVEPVSVSRFPPTVTDSASMQANDLFAKQDVAAKFNNTRQASHDGSAKCDSETKRVNAAEHSDGDDEWLDNGRVTDGGEEPPTSDFEGPLSTIKPGQSELSEGHRETTSNDPNIDALTASANTDAAARAVANTAKGRYKTGTSRSAEASRKLREGVNNGTYVVQKKKLGTWRSKIRGLDSNVDFDDKNPRRVFHQSCERWILVKEPGDSTRFREHLKACSAKAVPVEGTLMGMGWLKKVEKDAGRKEKVEFKLTMPCRGVTELDEALVDLYLNRTGAGGGGARSVHRISEERFGKEYRHLTRGQKDEVDAAQRAEWTWRNDHLNRRVHATNCDGFTSSRTLAASLCPKCSSLLELKAFKVAIHKKMPLDENAKFINTRYVNSVLAELYGRVRGLRHIIEQPNAKSTPCIRYTEAVLSGKATNEVFNGLLQAMCTELDKADRGVGLQNFKYAPAWDELCHIIYIVSPRAYRILRDYFPARTKRSFRQKEAREPGFPMGICDRTFRLAKTHLDELHYNGPVALACDDTKVFAALRLFWNKNEESYFLVGACGGPLRVPDVETAQELLDDPEIKKATKIRLWCMTIPVDGIAPIILAVLPISDSESSVSLRPHLTKILLGLIKEKIQVVSYSCDGTEVERKLQRLILGEASDHFQYKIKSPRPGIPAITVTIPVYNGQPLCLLQDSKHALKTLRNNLFSGARLLTLGNHVLLYATIRDVAFSNGSPLYRRDVEKLDRQDDNAASRLFSADTLSYLTNHHPDRAGEIVYLFVFGDLVDTYQNRSLSHRERIKMLLRAKYFLDYWKQFITHAGYKKSLHFLSREATDILRLVVEGLLALVYLYRDHLTNPDDINPLLPWLHSTEQCEHIFGEARQIVTDFCFLDFVYMLPKLRVTIREAILRARSNPRATASGYHHTHFDTRGLDIPVLATFPDDNEIDTAAEEAADEAESLLALLGLTPKQLQRNPTTVLPSIDSFLVGEEDGQGSDGADSDSEGDVIASEAQELQDLVCRAERSDEPGLSKFAEAAALVTADEFMRMYVPQELPEPDPEAETEATAEEFMRLSSFVRKRISLPALVLKDKAPQPSAPNTGSLDFPAMVELRRSHQTRYAAEGVRTRDVAETDRLGESVRLKLMRELNTLLRKEESRATGTGQGRKLRWIEPTQAGARSEPENEPTPAPTGNSANAAIVAQLKATKVFIRYMHFLLVLTSAQALDYRRGRLSRAGVPLISLLETARVSALSPITVGRFAWVFLEKQVVLAQGEYYCFFPSNKLRRLATSCLSIFKIGREEW